MDPNTLNRMQKEYNQYVAELQGLTKKINGLAGPRSTYLSQSAENEAVKAEMELLADDAVIYKQVGPVLVKQEVDEVKGTVENRLTFIKGELTRISKQDEELNEKKSKLTQKLMQLQKIIQEAASKLDEGGQAK